MTLLSHKKDLAACLSVCLGFLGLCGFEWVLYTIVFTDSDTSKDIIVFDF